MCWPSKLQIRRWNSLELPKRRMKVKFLIPSLDTDPETGPGLAGEVRRDNLLGTIHGSRWGPLFRLSLQLFIRSKSKGWATILAFKASENNHGAHGDRIPALFLNGDQLHFRSSISGNANYKLQSRVTLNKWFSVVVQQHSLKGKVRGKDWIILISLYLNWERSGLFHCYYRWKKGGQCGK